MAGYEGSGCFIHGLWLHATSWAPWQELFAEAGYETAAPGWGMSRGPWNFGGGPG